MYNLILHVFNFGETGMHCNINEYLQYIYIHFIDFATAFSKKCKLFFNGPKLLWRVTVKESVLFYDMLYTYFTHITLLLYMRQSWIGHFEITIYYKIHIEKLLFTLTYHSLGFRNELQWKWNIYYIIYNTVYIIAFTAPNSKLLSLLAIIASTNYLVLTKYQALF